MHSVFKRNVNFIDEMKVNRIKKCKFIGVNIRIYRKRRGYTQQRLAELMDIPSSVTLSRWETGANIPSAENLEKLAGVLHIRLEDLFAEPNTYQQTRNEMEDPVYYCGQELCTRNADPKTLYRRLTEAKTNGEVNRDFRTK